MTRDSASLRFHGDRHVPVRQWVLTVPWHRRWLLARKPEVAKGVLRIALRVLFRFYARRLGVPQSGSPALNAGTTGAHSLGDGACWDVPPTVGAFEP